MIELPSRLARPPKRPHDRHAVGPAMLLAALLVPSVSLPARTDETALSITGTVLDEAGEPIEGAVATLHPQLSSRARNALRRAGESYAEAVDRSVTGSDGGFVLAAPGPGSWTVLVRAEGRLALRNELDTLLPTPPGATSRPTGLAPVTLPTAGPVEIRISGAAGSPDNPTMVTVNGPDSYVVDEGPRFGQGWSAAERVAIPGEEGTVRVEAATRGPSRIRVYDGARLGWLDVDDAAAEGRPIPVTVETVPSATTRWVLPDGRPAREVLVWTSSATVGRTDDDGRIDVPLAPGSAIRAAAGSEEDGFGAIWSKPIGEVTTVVLRRPFPVDGRIVDAETGAPVSGALVWLSDDPRSSVTTGRDGEFRLDGASEPASVRAAAPGFADGSREIERPDGANGPARTIIALERRAWIEGRVLDPEGAPLANARVSSLMEPGSSVRGPYAWTGPDGGFLLTDLDPAEPHRIAAWLPGHAPAIEEVAPVPTGNDGSAPPYAPLDLVIHPSLRVVGRAIDVFGQPVGGARATLVSEDSLSDRNLWVSISTYTRTAGEDGRFAFENPAPLRSLVTVRADGFAPYLREGIEIATDAGVIDLGDVVLPPPATVRGRVVDSAGEPVAGAEIHDESFSIAARLRDLFDGRAGDAPLAVSDAEGSFSARELSPGQLLVVKATAGSAISESQRVYATLEPVPFELAIELQAPARIAGRVLDPDGHPVAGAAVSPAYGARRATTQFRWVETDARGRFELTVPEPGVAVLEATAATFARSEPVEVEVATGQRADGVEIVLRTAHLLAGRIVDPGGRPIESVDVWALPGSRAVRTDADGRFAIEDLPAGPLTLSLRRDGYRSFEADVRLVPKASPVEVVYPTAEVTGVLRRADGSPAVGYRVRLRAADSRTISSADETVTATDGSFRYRGLADGAYALSVALPGSGWAGWRWPETVVVAGGESRSGIVVRLPAEPER